MAKADEDAIHEIELRFNEAWGRHDTDGMVESLADDAQFVTSGPNRVQQIILGDHALSILNQINQQIENLRLDGDLLGTSPKLAPVDIQGIVLEEKLHLDDLLGSHRQF